MLPGPDQILECPSCCAPVARPTILSGNTFGATWYTDGYMDAPMLPRPAVLVRCPECAAPFLARRARPLGELDRYGMGLLPDDDGGDPPDPSWQSAQEVGPAQLGDYAAVLVSTPLERDLELALRLEGWHVGNHARRSQPEPDGGSALSVAEAANLRGLMRLLDAEPPEDRLMLAEARRELGEYEAALAVLAGDFPEEFALAANRIRALAEARQARVVVLFGGEEHARQPRD